MGTKPSLNIGSFAIGQDHPFFLIAGPCVIEDETITMTVARFLKEHSESLDIPVIFKTSYDKANRTSLDSFRGPGLEQGLRIIERVKSDTGLPILSDVHRIQEVPHAAQVLDIIQIPAFLCRQTDLIVAAARTGRPINIKKGQFISPYDIGQVIEKVTSTGNHDIVLTERGTCFGYHNLVVDIRSIPIMRAHGYPVVFDATHSVQLPGAAGASSGGQREFVGHLAKAAAAAGADGIFMEIHPDPDSALCDGPNALPLDSVPDLLQTLREIHRAVRS